MLVSECSNVELPQFAEVLIGEDDSFFFKLETRPSKRSSINLEMFEEIKKFNKRLLRETHFVFEHHFAVAPSSCKA